MRTTSASLTSKSQVTVPAWVRKALNIEPKMEIIWLELKPGEISVLGKSSNKKKKKLGQNQNPIDELCGILKGKGNDDIDLVQSLLDDRKNDLKLEERGFS